MFRLVHALMAGSILVAVPAVAWAQEAGPDELTAAEAYKAAREALAANRFPQAADWLEIALASEPQRADWWLLLGNCYHRIEARQADEARAYEKALQLDAGLLTAARRLLTLAGWFGSAEQNDRPRARAIYQQLIKLDDADVQAEATLGLALSYAPGQWDEALAGFEAFITKFGRHRRILTGRYHRALTLQDRAAARPLAQHPTQIVADEQEALAEYARIAAAEPASAWTARALEQALRIADRYAAAGARPLQVEILKQIAGWPLTPELSGKALSTLAGRLQEWGDAEFQANVERGRPADNAKLTAGHVQAIEVYLRLIDGFAAHREPAYKALAGLANTYHQAEHDEAARQVFELVIAKPDRPQVDRARLELARLLAQQGMRQLDRRLAAGLAAPQEIGATLTQAIGRVRQIAAEDPTRPVAKQALQLVEQIVGRFQGLKRYSVAIQAARLLLDDRDAGPLEDFVILQTGLVQVAQGREALARELARYRAVDDLKRNAEFATAIQTLQGLLDRYAEANGSVYLDRARQAIRSIAETYERHKAFAVAIEIYQGFVAANAKRFEDIDQEAYSVAKALHRQAAEEFAKQEHKPQAPPALSEAFQAAIDAIGEFLGNYPQSRLAEQAQQDLLEMALTYAKARSWQAARQIHELFLQKNPDYRYVGMIHFRRGVCYVGEIMPEHAINLLSATRIAPPVAKRPPPLAVPAMPKTGRAGGQAGEGAPAADRMAEPGGVTAGPSRTNGATADEGDFNGKLEVIDVREPAPADFAYSRVRASLAAIREQERQQAIRVAKLDEKLLNLALAPAQPAGQAAAEQQIEVPMLSAREMERQDKAIDAAYGIFLMVLRDYADRPAARQARAEILVLLGHYESTARPEKAAALLDRFAEDLPEDPERPKLALRAARDIHRHANNLIGVAKDEKLGQIETRFADARKRYAGLIASFPDEKALVAEARFAAAQTYLDESRQLLEVARPRARGRFVLAARQFERLAGEHPDHPQRANIPQLIAKIAAELRGQKFWDEAISVYSDLIARFPLQAQQIQAVRLIADIYREGLKDPLQAVEAYQEFLFTGGDGQAQQVQQIVLGIGRQLSGEKRYIEALHVFRTFVDSFPKHPQADEALKRIGDIHLENQAWDEAIAAYEKILSDYPKGQQVPDARLAIAECYINLSRWAQAYETYETFAKEQSKHPQADMARSRLAVLKDIRRFQDLIDTDKENRKIDDAQYQIALIVQDQLQNRVKAILEFAKVVSDYPQSHQADNAQYLIGRAYLALGKFEEGREALRLCAASYPSSPLADDALFQLGKSYEQEASQLRAESPEQRMKELAVTGQREAYKRVAEATDRLAGLNVELRDAYRQKGDWANLDLQIARGALGTNTLLFAQVTNVAEQARQAVRVLSALELARREDKINAALRRAVEAYTQAADNYPLGDYTDESLLSMATIYAEQLKNVEAAMATYQRIVKHFAGTARAEDASWKLAEFYERQGKHEAAVAAYRQFIRNYQGSKRVADAQFALAENLEALGRWVEAMDAYTTYIGKWPKAPKAAKARDQINWIKAYRL